MSDYEANTDALERKVIEAAVADRTAATQGTGTNAEIDAMITTRAALTSAVDALISGRIERMANVPQSLTPWQRVQLSEHRFHLSHGCHPARCTCPCGCDAWLSCTSDAMKGLCSKCYVVTYDQQHRADAEDLGVSDGT